MIELLQKTKGNVVGFELSGKLTDEDYKTILIPELEKRIEEHGKVRLLLHTSGTFEGLEVKALWDDVVFGMKHRKDFERFALVGGPRWMEWALGAGKYLFTGVGKAFPETELDTAWEWVRETEIKQKAA